ncbi:TrkA C-terminal domain-containing protein [Bacillus sp. FJAT-29814]|uniref:TrkA C-terminal domain-containing protein n=1 Tax=Bacillus sp. FJAT-29814 TaxID=1729688 RepID=UPI00082D8BB5|nr:TrkA C-terminal domain-containing protein [Bacillus sp. FJAT-29814]
MIFFLLIYFMIIFTVIEIFVVLFRLTRLKVEVSRFQVISMMTGTGFTTDESELISGHPIRRKLATFLILFGVFSMAVIISSISEFLSNGLRLKEIGTAAAAVLLVLAILKLSSVQRLLFYFFNRKMEQTIELADYPIGEIFLKSNQDTMIGLRVYEDSQLANRTIRKVVPNIDEVDLTVLFIKRGNLTIRKNIYYTTLHEGDQLLLYGNKKVMLETFQHDIDVMKKHS